MENQYSYMNRDTRYYPFTENNPHDSWFKKLRVSLFGESLSESAERVRDRIYADRDLDAMLAPFRSAQGATPSPAYSPGFVGLNTAPVAFNNLTDDFLTSINSNNLKVVTQQYFSQVRRWQIKNL